MNFPSVSVLLWNVQTAYSIDGVEMFASQNLPEECNFLPGEVGKHFLLAFNKTLGE